MVYVPPPMSEQTMARTHRCVRCRKLTDPKLDHCDYCQHVFSDEERAQMAACFEERRRIPFSTLAFSILLVAVVILVLITW